MTTHMVAVGGFNGLRTRLDSSLVAKWPDPINLASDIFIPAPWQDGSFQVTVDGSTAVACGRIVLILLHAK